MLIYFLVLLVPLAMGFLTQSETRINPIAFWLYFLVLLVFCGFRFEVGPDWESYLFIYEFWKNQEVKEVFLEREPAFYLLVVISGWFDLGNEGVVFACSLIFLFGCFSYARRTSNAWLAVAVVIPYLIFIVSMSGMRQAAAIGLGFYMLANKDRFSYIGSLFLVVLAISFHNSAAIFVTFIIFGMKGKIFMRTVMMGLVALFVITTLAETESFDRYRTTFIEDNLLSEGAVYHVLLVAFPSLLYILFRKKFELAGLADKDVFLASLFTMMLFPLLPLSSTGIDRLTLYFSFVQMWTYPALVNLHAMNASAIKLAIAALVLAIFFVYFLYGTHVSNYVPYQNFLFI